MSTQHAQYVILFIFSSGGKYRPVSNFTELHALTLAARCYAVLTCLHILITARVCVCLLWNWSSINFLGLFL